MKFEVCENMGGAPRLEPNGGGTENEVGRAYAGDWKGTPVLGM